MPKKIESSPVYDMLEKIRRKTKPTPQTIADAIHTYLKPERQWEFRSYMTTAARLLRQGAEFDDVVNSGAIVPAKKRSGKMPLWASHVNPANYLTNKIERDWTQSTEIVAIRNDYRALNLLESAEADAQLALVAKAGKKLYAATTFLINLSNAEAMEERTLRESAEQALANAEARAEAAESKLESDLKRIAVEAYRELQPA